MSDRLAFSGLRIVDFTSYFTGPYATSLLADQGADVIKVEAAPAGDLMRQFGTSRDGQAATFESVNHSKRSIALNLKDPGGVAVARRLMATADVVVENFRPGVAERLGVDYESCCKVAPEIIYLSISGYGNEGPYGGMPAFDTIIQGHAGFAYAQGVDVQPEFVRQAVVDKVTALYAAQILSSALYARAVGKGGDHIQLSMFDAALAFLWPDGMNDFTFLDGEVRTAPSSGSLYTMQKTKDGYIAISAVTNAQFYGLCRAVDRSEMVGDPRIDDLAKRIEQRTLMLDVRSSALNFTTEELCLRLRAEDVPHGPILSRADVVASEQFKHAHMHEYGGPGLRTRIPASPARSKSSPIHPPSAAPRAGQHSREILTELGFAPAEVDGLVARAAVLDAHGAST